MNKRRKIQYVNKPFHEFKPKQRATLVLDMAGFTIREIATLLKMSTSTVTSYILKGYEHLGDRLRY
jgi:DNA-directed RNA polymerase specialized sigma24 family protein